MAGLSLVPFGFGTLRLLLEMLKLLGCLLQPGFCFRQLCLQFRYLFLTLNHTNLSSIGVRHQQPVTREPDTVPGDDALARRQTRSVGHGFRKGIGSLNQRKQLADRPDTTHLGRQATGFGGNGTVTDHRKTFGGRFQRCSQLIEFRQRQALSEAANDLLDGKLPAVLNRQFRSKSRRVGQPLIGQPRLQGIVAGTHLFVQKCLLGLHRGFEALYRLAIFR